MLKTIFKIQSHLKCDAFSPPLNRVANFLSFSFNESIFNSRALFQQLSAAINITINIFAKLLVLFILDARTR